MRSRGRMRRPRFRPCSRPRAPLWNESGIFRRRRSRPTDSLGLGSGLRLGATARARHRPRAPAPAADRTVSEPIIVELKDPQGRALARPAALYVRSSHPPDLGCGFGGLLIQDLGSKRSALSNRPADTPIASLATPNGSMDVPKAPMDRSFRAMDTPNGSMDTSIPSKGLSIGPMDTSIRGMDNTRRQSSHPEKVEELCDFAGGLAWELENMGNRLNEELAKWRS